MPPPQDSSADGPAPVPPQAPHIRSFHPRRSRTTPSAASALDRLWPAYGLVVDRRPLDLATLFGPGVPVVLEIGSGMGEAAAQMAADDPATGVLAVDVHTPGLGALLHQVEVRGLPNVRVARGDAVELLRDMLAPASLAGVRLYFPDPWPKARHHKRRLIQPPFVALLCDRLRPGAVVHLATDWPPYADRMRDVLDAEPLLRPLGPADRRPPQRPRTRYEDRGLRHGHEVTDLWYVRTFPAGKVPGPS